MKTTGISIGNYLSYGGCVTVLNEKEIVHFTRFPETYEPITLTEEWLSKFGFVYKTGWDDMEFYTKDFVEITYNEQVKFKNDLGNEIKYVHQLQNLYFALTGEELKGI